MISEGTKVPEFTLIDHEGKAIRLSEFKGKKVALYFYPEDDTPGCTKEACAFRDNYALIKKTGAEILGVSMDDQNAHQKFRQKYNLPFPLLVDDKAELAKAFDVYVQKNLFGRKYWGIERSTFIIDAEGVVKKIFRRVNVDGHEREVLAALQEI
jgi:peroxiredoxin Q/BCP